MFAHSCHDGQDRLSLPAIFFDSSQLIPLHPRNSTFGLRQSRLWPLHFIKNCYRKILKVAQAKPVRRLPIVLCILFTLLLSPVTVVYAAETPKRIISLAPNLTEILFELGLGERIAGVTSFCDYPEEAKKVRKVGGMSNPSLEAVVSLKPDLVVMTTDGNPKEFAEKLRALQLKTYVFRARRISELPQGIRDLGTALGIQDRADVLADETQKRIDGLKAGKHSLSAPHSTSQRMKVLYIVWPEPLIVAGRGTVINDAISLLGAENIAAAAKASYPKYSVEEILRVSPDVIFIGNMNEEIRKVSAPLLKKLKTTAAVKNGRVFFVSDLLYRLGPRTVRGMEELAVYMDK